MGCSYIWLVCSLFGSGLGAAEHLCSALFWASEGGVSFSFLAAFGSAFNNKDWCCKFLIFVSGCCICFSLHRTASHFLALFGHLVCSCSTFFFLCLIGYSCSCFPSIWTAPSAPSSPNQLVINCSCCSVSGWVTTSCLLPPLKWSVHIAATSEWSICFCWLFELLFLHNLVTVHVWNSDQLERVSSI